MLCIHLLDQECCNNLLQSNRILRCLDQCHFKQSVVKYYIFPDHIRKAANGTRIRHHTEDKFVLDNFPVMLHLNFIGRNVKDSLCAFQYIRHMTKYIFHCLICLVGHICKNSKCCNINKYAVIELSNVARKWNSLHRIVCCRKGFSRNVQTLGKIIRRSCRNISYRNNIFSHLTALHHSSRNLVNRSISTATRNQIIFANFVFLDLIISVPVCLCRMHCHFISRFHKDIKNI